MSETVPLVRPYWGLIRHTADGRAAIDLLAREPTAKEVYAADGVLLWTGMLKGDCPSMTIDIVGQLPAMPRAEPFSGVSDGKGIATIVFSPAFAAIPKVIAQAVPSVLAGPVKAEVVDGSLTKTGCKVKVTSTALTTGVVTALAGATVNVIAFG